MANINYKELRIGNLIYVTDTLTNLVYQLPTRTNIHNFMLMTSYDKSPCDLIFEPIPISEIWLIRLGFTKEEYEDETLISFHYGNRFSIEVEKGIYDFKWWNQERVVNIKYIHQLENLYFSIYENEIDFDLDKWYDLEKFKKQALNYVIENPFYCTKKAYKKGNLCLTQCTMCKELSKNSDGKNI